MKHAIFALLAAAVLSASSIAAMAQPDDRRIEVGGFITTIDLRDAIGEKPLGVGARFAYNFSDHVSLDTEISYAPQNGQGDFGETMALAGVKVGKRWRKAGVFAKARPGLIHFGGSSYNQFNNVSPMKFALDLGGVVEFYPTKRSILRVDVGDTFIPFGGDTFATSTPPFIRTPGRTHNLQTSFGFGYRF